MRVQLGADSAHENNRANAGSHCCLAQDARTVHVHREVGLGPVPPHRDEADDVLDALRRLRNRLRVERIPHDHLSPANLEGGRLQGVPYKDAQLVPGVQDLVSHGAADKAGGAEEQNPSHGSES